MSDECKICKSKTIRLEKRIRRRAPNRLYRRCTECEFISLEDSFLLTSEEEFDIYERHENSIEDPAYVGFFQSFIENAIVDHMDKEDARCLDFGSGPSPVLAQLLEGQFDWSVDRYDKFYTSEKVYEGNRYDLITSTEVVEHLDDPLHYFRLFKSLLAPDGILSIMTLFHPGNDEDFADWFYPRDPSHISFYTPKTMEVIAEQVGLAILYCDDHRYITLSHD